MASGENALRGQIMELREKIVAIKEEIAQLQKRRKVHIAKLKLMENHLSGYSLSEGIKNEHTDSSDQSFSTTELLELSSSSVSSSILDSSSIRLHSDNDLNDSDSNIEDGKHG